MGNMHTVASVIITLGAVYDCIIIKTLLGV